MGELTEIRKDVSYLRGQWDATVPELAKTAEVANMIASHKMTCRKSLMPKPNTETAKTWGKIGAAIGVAAGALYALVQLLMGNTPTVP